MTRPVLSSYTNIELPEVGGDSAVWGTVLNNALNQIDDLIYTNQTSTTTNTTNISTLNADSNTTGSVDQKVATAITALRGTSTQTLQSLESLIGDSGNIDLSSINSAITNLQTNLGAPTNAALSTAVYPRVTTLESSMSTLHGSTTGDDGKSVRTIATELIAASNTGITSVAAQGQIDDSIALIQGNTTQTIAGLLTLITDLTARVVALEQTVEQHATGKASAATVTALSNTVNGGGGVIGLVTTVNTVSSSATLAKQTADQATLDVSSLNGTVGGFSTRISGLENAGYITSTALSDYYTATESNNRYLTSGTLTTTLQQYATKNFVEGKGYLTAVPSNYPTVNDMNIAITNATSTSGSYVSTSDANWKKVRGLFEGQADGNRTLPSVLYLSSSTSGYRNAITYYTSSNDPVFMYQTTSNSNTTYKNMYTATSSSGDILSETTKRKLDALINGTGSSNWNASYVPQTLYVSVGSSSTNYIAIHARNLSAVPSNPSRVFYDPILFYSNYKNGVFQDNYSVID